MGDTIVEKPKSNIYVIEGLDRLGKSTLVKTIKNRFGFYQTIHCGKPEALDVYSKCGDSLERYQICSFLQTMLMATSETPYRLIFDRWHLGEAVYAPLYRGYNGDYVFALEKECELDKAPISLILLTENMDISTHFESDGASFDDSKRADEQQMFIEAFNKSIIRDKRIVCVTDPKTGGFRSPQEIFTEATS